jgi:hypothetical protein
MKLRILAAGLALLSLLVLQALAAEPQISDMRADSGVLEEFRPCGAAFCDKDKVLVVDQAYDDFHIFTLDGRRWRLIPWPGTGKFFYHSALAPLGPEPNTYLMAGSHWHEKNNPRYVYARSYIQKVVLQGENVDAESLKTNLSPDRQLRETGFYGQSVQSPGELTGLAVDLKQKRLFIAWSRVLEPDGTVVLEEAPLEPFLRGDKKGWSFKEVKDKLVPETDPTLGLPYRVSDLAYVPGQGLLVLMCADSPDGKRFGANQIWILRGGFGPARLLMKDLLPGNRAEGLAVRDDGKGLYTLAITCNNNMAETGIPSRLAVFSGVKL